MSRETPNLVNLNVNPCKMCMPMGAVSAFYGIRGCMTILHGSQGCATYIRRHMATHYNEPVDVASSSLTEQGTVFGGESNLMRGLDNLVALYNPEVIGIATTCLAETIGEDVAAVIKKYEAARPGQDVKLIHVSSAGYGGTQNEGFFRALRAIVEQVDMLREPNNRINIITPLISPADTRWLRALLDGMGLSCVLLPDISENLDGGHAARYDRLPRGGTSLADIRQMAGARMTIELSLFPGHGASPAEALRDLYDVPFVRLPLPCGMRGTDALIAELEKLGGVLPETVKRERARLADGMIDAHKYSADARAALAGEPDFVLAAARLCAENGVTVPLAATGSVSPELTEALHAELDENAALQMEEPPLIEDDSDFERIERHCGERNVAVFVGSSDARRLTRRLGITLVRAAFPIHDRVGGQRVRMLGYEGSLDLLERIANAALARRDETYRKEAFKRYYREPEAEPAGKAPSSAPLSKEEAARIIAEKTRTHPCYTCGSGEPHARMHLPVAPKCNIQCNYCLRKYDCPNESRPGVTAEVLRPEEAAARYRAVKKKIPNLTVVGVAGPGDALADFENTAATLRMIREEDPSVTFCLSTNGLMLPLYAQEVIDLGVSHVTVTINAVDPQIGARIYKHVDYMGRRYTGAEGAAVLMANQLAGLRYLTRRGVVCKVNTVVLKGINDTHIEEVVRTVKELGAYISNIMQIIPVPGSAFENMEQVSMKEINDLRKACGAHLRQMYHCRQCRADAVGTLGNDRSIEFRGCGISTKRPAGEADAVPDPSPPPSGRALRFAVATAGGMLVDTHFGHAKEFYIYESDGENARFVEKRRAEQYCAGADDCGDSEGRMDAILRAVADCAGVLALRIGNAPSQKLKEKGIAVFMSCDRIEDAVRQAARGMA